jgi:hypothetical protein
MDRVDDHFWAGIFGEAEDLEYPLVTDQRQFITEYPPPRYIDLPNDAPEITPSSSSVTTEGATTDRKLLWFTNCVAKFLEEECNKLNRAILVEFLRKVVANNTEYLVNVDSYIHRLIRISEARSLRFSRTVLHLHKPMAATKSAAIMLGLANQVARQNTLETIAEYLSINTHNYFRS